jgi:condensin complex subunit 2
MDGPGFELPDNTDPIGDGKFVESDDYVVQEIEGVRKVEKVRVNHANVAKRVDVKRLKKELWAEVESKTASDIHAQVSLSEEQPITDPDNKDSFDIEGLNSKCEQIEDEELDDGKLSFKETVFKMEATEAQEDVSLAFYFICMLHLANEKGLKLENGEHGLNDFVISKDDTIEGPKTVESSRSLRPNLGSSKILSSSPARSDVESDDESDFE